MKNLNHLFLTLCLLLIALFGFSQQPQWYIKNTEATVPYPTDGTGNPSYLFNFIANTSLGTPQVSIPPYLQDNDLPGNNINIEAVYSLKEADNAIYDENGDLEIFIAQDMVYDVNGTFLNRLTDANGSWFPFTTNNGGIQDRDLAICRVPESCSKYYIIRYAPINSTANYRLHYYIYDTSTNHFEDQLGVSIQHANSTLSIEGEVLGNLVTTNNVLSNIGQLGDTNLAISKLNHNNERLLFFGTKNDIFLARIDNSGINFTPTTNNALGQFFPTYPWNGAHPFPSFGSQITEMEVIQLANGSYRLARVSGLNGTKRVFIVNVNSDGTLNTVNPYDYFTYSGHIRGVEFSPDGNHLYVTKLERPHIQYVDVTTHNNPFHTLSLPSPHNSDTYREQFQIGSIEMAHDGKMYFAGYNGLSSLADPNNPNGATNSSNWIDNAVPHNIDEMYSNTNQQSNPLIPLPEQVDGELLYTPMTNLGPFYNCGNTITSGCVNDYLGFEYNWYQTNPWTGVSVLVGSGNCFTPETLGNSSYTLKVTDENKCTKSYQIDFINNTPQLPQLPDVQYCSLTEDCPIVGWNLNLSDYPNITSTQWYYNGSQIDLGSQVQLNIPCQSEGIGDGSFSTPDEYSVVVNSACGTQTFSFTVTNVYQHFSASIIANIETQTSGNQVLFHPELSMNSTFAFRWTVNKNGNFLGIFNNYQTPYFTFSSGDQFEVNLFVTNFENCQSYSRTIEYNVPENVTSGNSAETPWSEGMVLEANPNPVANLLNLTIENSNSDHHQATILNLDGRILLETTVFNNRIEIDMSSFAPGNYFVRVFNEFESASAKIIKY